ncbi:MAG TPA: tRNA pseudouridine(55) synthase TruB [Polyangiales bacterium]
MTTSPASEPHGLLILDKCPGPTSHDAVAVARRALGTKAVGHTGTLDPMASGVLVVVVGEATKLVNLLSVGEKSYDASIQLGQATSTLDAEGEVSESAPVPSLTLEAVREASRAFLGETQQRPPAVSAIKVDGKSLHKRVRAGEQVEAPLRQVRVEALSVHALEGDTIRLSVCCSKGFYVRALARDLAQALGTVGHLTALRRTSNAGFGLEHAISFDAVRAALRADEAARQAVRARLIPLAQVCQRLPHRQVDAELTLLLGHGRSLSAEHPGPLADLSDGQPVIALREDGAPVAIVERSGSALRVVRGFRDIGSPDG